jgi:hypothetical protein
LDNHEIAFRETADDFLVERQFLRESVHRILLLFGTTPLGRLPCVQQPACQAASTTPSPAITTMPAFRRTDQLTPYRRAVTAALRREPGE